MEIPLSSIITLFCRKSYTFRKKFRFEKGRSRSHALLFFFIFFMPSTTEEHAGNRYYRDLGVDIVFVQQRNLVNGNQKIQEIAEFLDLTLDTFWYADNSDLRTLLPTSERQWNIEDEELHYQFHIRQRVALQAKENLMSDMEENDIGIKEDR